MTSEKFSEMEASLLFPVAKIQIKFSISRYLCQSKTRAIESIENAFSFNSFNVKKIA
jgi:hypothetical protein